MLLATGKNRAGFTLVELLVLLALGAFLLGMLLPAVARVRGAAARAQCQNNLKQINLATIHCADTYRGRMPPLAGAYPDNNSFGTVFFHILPYLEQNALYLETRTRQGGYSVWQGHVFRRPVVVYTCPADRSRPDKGVYQDWLATANYAANFLVFGDVRTRTLQGRTRFPASFTDGTSNTIMFAERYQVCRDQPCAWGYPGTYYWAPMFAFYSQGKFQIHPTAAECDPARAQGVHAAGLPVGMGDGSVRILTQKVSPQTWWYACTPSGGEPLGEDWN
jgi:hypothetical protein